MNTTLSRRNFLGGTAALTAAAIMPGQAPAKTVAKPNSKFDGVQIGVITYSYRNRRCRSRPRRHTDTFFSTATTNKPTKSTKRPRLCPGTSFDLRLVQRRRPNNRPVRPARRKTGVRTCCWPPGAGEISTAPPASPTGADSDSAACLSIAPNGSNNASSVAEND